jgi:hypothetical protein
MQQDIGKPRGFGDYLSDLLGNYEELIAGSAKSPGTNLAQSRPAGATVSSRAAKARTAPDSVAPRMRQKFSLFHTEGRKETIKQWISPYAGKGDSMHPLRTQGASMDTSRISTVSTWDM